MKANEGTRESRAPDGFGQGNEERRRRKWEPIISAFLEGRIDELKAVRRDGARGRIFQRLVRQML
jgi:hypothetical protein